jgi:hypothetical protein
MKSFALIAALLSSATFSPFAAAQEQTLQFKMTVSDGASICLPNAWAEVTDHTFGNFENLEVVAHELPPNTGFDFFIIQVPNSLSGLPGIWATLLPTQPGPESAISSAASAARLSLFLPARRVRRMNFPTRLP